MLIAKEVYSARKLDNLLTMASAITSSDELWRECAEWLTRCDVIRRDHRVNLPTAGIVHLATILRDGVLLCNLLNVLDPGCIDLRDVNQKPHMAQVSFSFISYF